MHDDLEHVLAFYREREEGGRLRTGLGRVEATRVRRLVADALGDGPLDVLDVGGGPGAHAGWLAGAGHRVTLLDVVPEHVRAARDEGLSAAVADARHLPIGDASADVVLLLGPLYHLVDTADRHRALAEAHRVLRPGGLLAATAVTRVSVVLDQLRGGGWDDPDVVAAVERIVATGHDPEDEAPVFHCHDVPSLHAELLAAAFEQPVVHGIEGPAWALLPADVGADDPRLAHVLRIAELSDGDPSLTGASAHLLALARRA